VNTPANVSPFSRSPSRRALRSPRSVSGRSVRPVCCPVIVQAVSPCLATYVMGSGSLMDLRAVRCDSRVVRRVARRRASATNVPLRAGMRRNRNAVRTRSPTVAVHTGCRCHDRSDETGAANPTIFAQAHETLPRSIMAPSLDHPRSEFVAAIAVPLRVWRACRRGWAERKRLVGGAGTAVAKVSAETVQH
jgi:hypothetical protein